MRRGGRWLLTASALGLASCTTVPTAGSAGTHYYLGLVRVVYPDSIGQLVAADVKTLGVGVDRGAFLGWRNSRFVFAKPGDCRIVIMVRDHAELENVEKLIKSMEGACLTGTGVSSLAVLPASH